MSCRAHDASTDCPRQIHVAGDSPIAMLTSAYGTEAEGVKLKASSVAALSEGDQRGLRIERTAKVSAEHHTSRRLEMKGVLHGGDCEEVSRVGEM